MVYLFYHLVIGVIARVVPWLWFEKLPLGYRCYNPGCPLAMVYLFYHLVIDAITRVVPWLWLKNYHLVIGVISRVVPWLWFKKLQLGYRCYSPGCPLAIGSITTRDKMSGNLTRICLFPNPGKVNNHNLAMVFYFTRVVPWLWVL